MRIVHTADWHLGKNLEGHSRLDEQEEFLNFFIKECNNLKPDIILIAGDIYDTVNPPARAEKLFYDSLKKLSRNGECIMVVISGNHDSPERLISATPLAMEHGIIMSGTLNTIVPTGSYGKHRVLESFEGFVKLSINDKIVNLINMPYPSEKRLEEIFDNEMDSDTDRQKNYSDKVNDIFTKLGKNFDENINLVISHIFAFGSEPTGSERTVSLGGSYLVSTDVFPKNADYIALGHIHKPQILPKTEGKIRYSGSPIHYNKSEINIQKKFFVIDIDENKKIEYMDVNIPVFKPIYIWKANSIEEAIDMCEENKDLNAWVYLEIKTDRYIREDEMKKMKSFKKDILEIVPIIERIEDELSDISLNELSFKEQFIEFYKVQREVEPDDKLIEMFMNILSEDFDEAN